MTPNDSQKLEALISQAVKDLPSRSAPRSLESRILAEIDRRAQLPWYRQSYSRWPMAMRGVFLVVSAGAAAVATMALVPYVTGVAPAAIQPYASSAQSWYDSLRETGQVFSHLGSDTLSRIPTLWLYTAAATIAGCYAALVGLGTAAYRAVRTNSNF